jgi:hypothetical protein
MSTPIRIFTLVVLVAGSIGVGYWLQRDVPNEKNRVRHPQAYSIIRPDDWSAEVSYADAVEKLGGAVRLDGLALTPDHFDGMPPRLFVNRFSGTPNQDDLRADGWTDGLFQGQPAFVREKKLPKALSRAAAFQRGGHWFEVVEGLSVAASLQKDQWWRFLETFRYPDGQPPSATTAPATAGSLPASTEPFNF